MKGQGRIKERDVLILLGTILIFLWINFNPEVGSLYLGMILLSYLMFKSDKIVSIFTEKKKSDWFTAILFAVAAYALFVVISGLAIGLVSPSYVIQNENTFSMVARTMATTTPILAGSIILTILSWGFLAATIESDFFFGKLLEWSSEKTNTPLKFDILKRRAWMLVIGLSFIFAFFHMSVKGIVNNQALLLTFIFALISCWLVLKMKETKSAILFHIISNTIAVMTVGGMI